MTGIIYKATNKTNGHCYIGKTTENLNKRIYRHIQSIKKETNIHFYNAIRKHGKDNFGWEILTETDSESKLDALEKFYIAAYRKITILYNMTDGGEGRSGYFLSQKTKTKISESNKGRIAPNKGIKHSEETKNKIREKAIGRKASEKTKIKMSKIRSNFKGKYSVETCQKLSDARKKQIPPMLNKNHSIESKIKMSQSAFRRWSNNKNV